jgi:GT2 family glycosyltransferase
MGGSANLMDLSIIIVNWNSVNYLRDCVASILAYTRGISFEIVVVDNASPGGDADIIEQDFKNIVFIRSPKNLGFAGANNLGFRRASGEYVLFLNPDTKLINPAINLMLERLRPLADAGILGCKLLNSDLSVQTSSIQKFPTILNQVFQSEYLRLRWPSFRLWDIGPLFSNSPLPTPVEAITGACMMMKREVFEKVGLYSEDYWMYSEDLDLCFKVKSAGFRNYYTGDATILHYAGKSSNPGWALTMKLRSELRFLAISRGPFYVLAFRILLSLNAVARLAIIAVVYPFWRILGKQGAPRATWAKWRVVLRVLLAGSAGSKPARDAGKSVTDCVTRI